MRYLLFFLLSILVSACGQSDPRETTKGDPVTITSQVTLVADSEPGEPMVISGTIYLPDGRTPADSAVLAVWQTDASGNYIPGGGGAGELHPRIHGRMRTGKEGKYEFRTIRPGQYPSHTTPAHVHAHVSAPGFPEYAIIYYFEGDDLITDQNRTEMNTHRGGSPSIISLTKDQRGTWAGHRDIILEYVKPSDETLKLQW